MASIGVEAGLAVMENAFGIHFTRIQSATMRDNNAQWREVIKQKTYSQLWPYVVAVAGYNLRRFRLTSKKVQWRQ